MARIIQTIQDTTGSGVSVLWTTPTEPTAGEDLSRVLRQLNEYQKSLELMQTLMSFSDATGGYVQLRREYNYFPVLIGNDNRPVPLFAFVEVLDEAVNYDQIKEDLPNLSYSQINGAISFLRKVAQVNPLGIDVDDVEDELESKDSELLDQLRNGLADKEIARVFHHD